MTVSNGTSPQAFLFDFLLFCVTVSTYSLTAAKNNLSDTGKTSLGFADTTNATTLKTALLDGSTLNATENVCTVNEFNVPSMSGHARSEMRLEKLWHRATYIVIRHEDPDENEDRDSITDTSNTHILVQRRSNIKDYCPGKLDPTPGGVVGFGESYELNAQREIAEEMDIDVTTNHGEHNTGNSIRHLFTFPYQDDKVKCWGGMFEVVYRGKLSDIKMQPEEVSDILRISLDDLKTMADKNPQDWMPDGLHAIQLYLQYIRDIQVNRRLIKGYHGSDLAHYTLRPKPKVIFFDCDDCLYFDGWKVADRLTAKIEEWCTTKKNLPKGKAYELYKKHGTALRGLLAEDCIDESDEAIDGYLKDVHDLPIISEQLLKKDEALREMLLRIDPSIPKYVFTASVKDHAQRCLKALGIDDLFVDIIDVKSCNLATKHSKESFQAAMQIAGVDGDPESCIFLDDSLKNIAAARDIGWRSILVGCVGRDSGKTISSEHAEHEIDRIHKMPHVLPEFFPTCGDHGK